MKEYSGKVFPNFKRTNKWRGIIDYKSLTFVLIYIFIIWNICKIVNISAIYGLYIVVIFTIPIVSVMNAFSSEDNIVDVLCIIIKYLLSPKRYMYLIRKREYIQLVQTKNKDFVL
ncbi:MAG: hypothetical protein IKV94_00485 [Clostridia bacterium]|nr:hypothetical protein [Clostridia bacterium]